MTAATKAMRAAFIEIVNLASTAIIHASIVPVRTLDAHSLADVTTQKHTPSWLKYLKYQLRQLLSTGATVVYFLRDLFRNCLLQQKQFLFVSSLTK